MDRTFYALKRAYHSTLRITRRDFKGLEMTPARMDILHALYNRGRWKQMIWQSNLRRIIGYTARSTMSQIMKALEALQWVDRRRSQRDERQVELRLTAAGRDAIDRAHLHFFSGWAADAPSWAQNWAPTLDDEDQAWAAFVAKMGRLRKILFNIRFALRDTGSLRYSWSWE
jgi:DNA-binding MarR family transcriptional regulator